MNKPQTLKGFRDLLPKEAFVRNKVKETLIGVFESFGFEPLETPALEYQEVLLGKYGEEADKLVYTFNDKGGRPVGLRYDLTVPLARVLSTYQGKLPIPFKRYQIQNVYRADKPQKGRYREITQCDIDIVGSSTPLSDAEIVAVIEKSLEALRFKEFTIRINSRQVLFSIIEQAGITEDKQLTVVQSIDKLDKKTKEEVQQELVLKGLSLQTINYLFSLLKNAQPDLYLKELCRLLTSIGVKESSWKFDPILSRGLDYYTGPIFETVVTEPKVGSITGGGRYDKLLKLLGGSDLPATGTTIGLDRAVDVILELNLWNELSYTSTQVLVTIFSPELKDKSIEISSRLRANNINTDLYLDENAKIEKQLKYADTKGIPFVVIIGPEEAAKNMLQLKNMQSREQREMTAEQLVSELKS